VVLPADCARSTGETTANAIGACVHDNLLLLCVIVSLLICRADLDCSIGVCVCEQKIDADGDGNINSAEFLSVANVLKLDVRCCSRIFRSTFVACFGRPPLNIYSLLPFSLTLAWFCLVLAALRVAAAALPAQSLPDLANGRKVLSLIPVLSLLNWAMFCRFHRVRAFARSSHFEMVCSALYRFVS
jgi:hypothetical protein